MDYRINDLIQAMGKGAISEEDGMQLLKEVISLQGKIIKVTESLYNDAKGLATSGLTSPIQETKMLVKEAVREVLEEMGEEQKVAE